MSAINISFLARKNVLAMTPYSSARDEFKGRASVFLDANENPNPSPYNRYPDAHQQKLKQAIADLKNIKPNQLFIGNGSDEAIDLLLRVFCVPGSDNIIVPQPTYGMYATSAAASDIAVQSVGLDKAFDLDVDAILHVVNSKTKMISLCSPNNPTGNLLDFKKIEILLARFSGLVVVDEAYIDFAGTKSWISKLPSFQNLVVLQTFSKAWGLAGLRLGICIADPEIIQLKNKIKPPYNIGSFAQRKVIQVIRQQSKIVAQRVAQTNLQRTYLSSELQKLKIIKRVFPSQSNFLLVEVTDAMGIYAYLISKGIVVRDRSSVKGCENCLRISVGTPKENKSLIKVLKAI